MKKTPNHQASFFAFYQFSFSSGRSESLTINENEIRKHAEALLKKYGEKMVTVSKKGKPIMKFINREKLYSKDSKADLTGSTPVGNGYVKNSGSEWIVYDVNGNIIGRFTTYDEAVRKAKEL